MSYIINNSRGNVVAIVADGTVNTTATPLALVGRAVTAYGTYENENYVYLLENFAKDTAPTTPILGQLWYNSNSDTLHAYDSANTWTPLASQAFVSGALTALFISPSFSGVPTAPTAANGTANTQIATTAFVVNTLGGSNTVSATGNITGGNILTGGVVSATGNVYGAYFVGNIISPAGSNVSTTGNVTGGNILTSGVVSATGNVYGANFVGNVTIPAGSPVSTTGNVVGGNISATGSISATGNIVTTATVIANVVIANSVITTGTTSAFRLPNLSQTQINALSPQNGDMVYNTTTDLPQIYQSGSWKNFTISYYS